LYQSATVVGCAQDCVRMGQRGLCLAVLPHPFLPLEDENALVEITVMAPEEWRALPRGHFHGQVWVKLQQVEAPSGAGRGREFD
jgi:hypothetical protein